MFDGYSNKVCVPTPNPGACKAFFMPLLIGFFLGNGSFTLGDIFKRFLMIADIRVIGNDQHESMQRSFVMFAVVIKNADDIRMARQTFLGRFDVLGGSGRILIPGKLLYQALLLLQRFSG